MLPRNFRLLVVNKTGATIEFGTDAPNNSLLIDAVPWKISNGNLSYRSSQNLFNDNDVDLANNIVATGIGYDNSSNLDWGMHCQATLTTDVASASGTLEIYMELSVNSGTTFPSNSPDFIASQDLIHVGSLPTVPANEDRAINFEL